ncbi:MAG TPA: hypothetical protein VNS49_20465 [Streptomyces sp.]|nr:hypothetical protein [Streptomyces sp.]
MADDDRYRWLDDEVAEGLLRGSAVDARSAQRGGRRREDRDNVEAAPTSTSGRSGAVTPSWARNAAAGAEVHPADRLASVLDALVAEQTAMPHAMGAGRAGRLPGQTGQSAELPGEAAAIEAFRVAHAETLHSGTVDISAGPTESGTVVGRRAVREERRRSGGRRSGGPRRLSLGGRPLRAGFAMAVAGCALGGAAVAAGAGVLPTPFGGGGSPATSVSPLASPSGGDREAALGGGDGSPEDSNGPRRGTREGGSGPSDSPDGKDLAGTERGQDGKDSKGPGGEKGWQDGDGKGLSESEKKAIARAMCTAYEDQKLSTQDRLKLEAVAGGPAGVRKFCDKHGGNSGVQSGGVGTPGDSGGNGDGGDDGSGNDGGGDSGGDSDGGDSGGADGGDSGGDAGGGDASGGVGTPSNGGADGSGGDSRGQVDGSTPESGDDGSAASDDEDGSAEPDASASADGSKV